MRESRTSGSEGARGGQLPRATRPADDEGPDGVLDEVRIEREAAVVEHSHEPRPLCVEIGERLAGEALRRDGAERSIEPTA